MKLSQSAFSTLLLMLTTAVLAPMAGAVSAASLARSSVSSPSAQLISQAGVMSRGGSGPLVTTLQDDLATLGYFSSASTGYFGSATEDAVIRFQRDAGISADGRVGPGTQEAIRQRIGTGAPAVRPPGSSTTSLREGDSGDTVLALQNRLRTKGYFSGVATGYFGPVTREAVIGFQNSLGLSEDGIAGPAVFDALGIGF
jgi:peptidoglycan hydrolase-like protein with peptidoglycan-binding domain